jgi:lysylphosphatidylglycerol synthetase-like protein (DUF2156 family)
MASMTARLEQHDPRLGVLERHGTNPSGFLALNEGNRFFRSDGIDGFVAYRDTGRGLWIQFGGPFAADGDREPLLRGFLEFSRQRRARVVGVQLLREDAELQVRLGYRANQVGCSYSLPLDSLTLAGRRFVKTRNMVSRSRREGVEVVELGVDPCEVEDLEGQLDAVDAAWLRAKGRFVPELHFFVGERHGPFHPKRRVFVALLAGEIIAYITYSPVYGRHPGWLYDLTRRKPTAPPGVIEHIFTEAAGRMRSEGAEWLHLGLTPFVDMSDEHEVLVAVSRPLQRLLRFLSGRGGLVYPAASQLAFKRKWQPTLVQPEYVVTPGRPRATDAWRLMKVTVQ